MKSTYSLQLIACVLFVCLFLQNCSSVANLPLDNLEEHNKQSDMQAILDKEFVSEGGHLVTFYKEEDELKASVQVNPLDEVDKFYSGVEVLVEQGTSLAVLPVLDKKAQQRRLQVQFSKEGKPKSIVIHKPWLMGGGKTEPDEIIVFCGNPGVGKSSLCNSIFQQVVFRSGIVIGIGAVTKHQQEHMYENKLYIDTPGLDDVEMRMQAAAEIEKSLKHNNNYKIVFVATLESGRIKSNHLTTIKTVCDAIRVPFKYGLIFNKVGNLSIKQINPEKVLERYSTYFSKQPSSTLILSKDDNMDDEENKYFPMNSENRNNLIRFLNNLSPNNQEIIETIIFCGNPGIGKSTLCNSIFQRAIFNSGVSGVTGMTIQKQEYQYRDKLYIDTPGLADVQTRKQTALEIEKSIKYHNNYKIVFVATLESGRIKPDDLTTIETVCDAIKVPFEYGLVFNKVTKRVIEDITRRGLDFYLSSFKKKPYITVMLKRDDNIEDMPNAYFKSDSENRERLLHFISNLRSNRICASDVKPLDTTDYKAKLREIEEENRNIQEEHRRRVAKLNVQISRIRAERDIDVVCLLF